MERKNLMQKTETNRGKKSNLIKMRHRQVHIQNVLRESDEILQRARVIDHQRPR